MPQPGHNKRRILVVILAIMIAGTFLLGISCRNTTGPTGTTGEDSPSIKPDKWVVEWYQSRNQPAGPEGLTAPVMNIPVLDMVVTNERPLLSIYNASGGNGERTYTYQIDKAPTFDSDALIEYEGLREKNEYLTEKQVEGDDALEDGTTYYFRARAVDSNGNAGPWALNRFSLDTSYDDTFMNLTRVAVAGVEASSGPNPGNVTDWDYSSDDSFWAAAPPCDEPWLKFDLGRETTVSRIWQLCDKSRLDGWLESFVWQSSSDGETWSDIPGAEIADNDTYTNIIDFEPVSARYLRLSIDSWYGYAPRVFTVIPYSPGMPAVPETPDGDYVLVVGNASDGSTWTELARFIEGCGLGLKALTVPCYEVSLSMLDALDRKPVAIVLSGILGDRSPSMFEYGGEFEIIRETEIPLFGICFGHQFLAMAHGMTFVRGMGWLDDTSMEILEGGEGTEIDRVSQYEDLSIFDGIPDPFIAAEIHIWSIADMTLPDEYEIIAESGYIQMIKSKDRMVYGAQFHPEISYDFNQGSAVLVNFLEMALEQIE
ncbi:MAG: discoidin domain-containing protein [Actinomycetota bacterium]|nr:discoidin domain-containing protein [Actinomycetota bacterium]